MLDGFQDSEELEVVGVIILFGGSEGGGVIGHQVSLSWGYPRFPTVLRQDRSYPVLRGVGLEVEGFVEVGLLQDWLTDHFVA